MSANVAKDASDSPHHGSARCHHGRCGLVVGRTYHECAGRTIRTANRSGGCRRSCNTARVEERQAVQSQRFSGTITPLRQVTLVAQIGGRIESMVEEVGIEVTEGDVVAQLDVEELLLNLREREAALAQAEAYLDALRTGASEEEIRQAEANYNQAASAFQQAEETFVRAQTLYEQGVISREAFNGAQTQYEVARAQLDAAEQILAQTRRGARPEEIRAAEAQVEQARVGVEMVQKRLGRCHLDCAV